MSKVLCFGELLLHFAPRLQGEWLEQQFMPVYIGGAELNVARALASWNLPVDYCTALPDHYLTKEIITSLNTSSVGTHNIQFLGNRIGTYYLPQGADLKNAGVIYDRAHSSFWDLKPGVLPWGKILEGITWFHFSAISPALNEDVALLCREGVEYASRMGITISVDLNYRSKLWNYGKDPCNVMSELVQYCDVVMGNIWSAEALLGIPTDKDIHSKKSKSAYLQHATKTSHIMLKRYPKIKTVAHTFRFENDAGIRYYATADQAENQFVSKEYSTDHVIDQVGSGDAFMAGLIYGFYHNHEIQKVIDFASAAAFNKLFIRGDASTASVEEIMKRYIHYA